MSEDQNHEDIRVLRHDVNNVQQTLDLTVERVRSIGELIARHNLIIYGDGAVEGMVTKVSHIERVAEWIGRQKDKDNEHGRAMFLLFVGQICTIVTGVALCALTWYLSKG